MTVRDGIKNTMELFATLKDMAEKLDPSKDSEDIRLIAEDMRLLREGVEMYDVIAPEELDFITDMKMMEKEVLSSAKKL